MKAKIGDECYYKSSNTDINKIIFKITEKSVFQYGDRTIVSAFVLRNENEIYTKGKLVDLYLDNCYTLYKKVRPLP